ncbi:hypothetical protein L249_7262 [Ophiocordyceps polyrhachis-furcata BCC 54312]|uniref:Uncharacterized protein n=1 Tax=Ophiocordyceps polyrhachis-furcata BCC 54312 TaxID=1330021 RepID=A0A367L9S8_9HYPO|nr:hypothetical protein L249_7262 [Ophiocordyceps polyrhachis-furcata BCC 54312]
MDGWMSLRKTMATVPTADATHPYLLFSLHHYIYMYSCIEVINFHVDGRTDVWEHQTTTRTKTKKTEMWLGVVVVVLCCCCCLLV